jgi:hypothetical protein
MYYEKKEAPELIFGELHVSVYPSQRNILGCTGHVYVILLSSVR